MEGDLLPDAPPPRCNPRQRQKDDQPATPREKRETKRQHRSSHQWDHRLQPITPAELHFRHSHWSARRSRIRTAVVSCGAREAALDRWDNCGSDCVAEWSETAKRYRLRANYCKSRHCEPCARAKANLIARNLREKMEGQRPHTLRFITLTLKHTAAPLADQIRRINRCFKSLRSTPLWKTTQVGGAAIIEIKWSGTAWHVHLHIVAEGGWLSAPALSAAWLQITGDSFVVDVRILHHVKDACHYLAKYITKGTSPAVWETPDLAQEWITATRGVRVCNTFAAWRGFRLTKGTCTIDDWKIVNRLDVLIELARAGDQVSGDILIVLRPPGTADHIPAEQARAP